MEQKKLVLIKDRLKTFQLTWCINNICTNHCYYCPSYLNTGKNHHYDWSDAERFAHALLERHPKINVAITGGEPTVSPWLKDLSNLFLSRGHTVGLTSNGVRKGSYWDDCPLSYICLSYHAAYDDGSWVERAVDTQIRIGSTTARIMMDPLRWEQSLKTFWHVHDSTVLGVEAVKIVDWGAASQQAIYTQEQLETLRMLPSRPPITNRSNNVQVSTAVYSDYSEEFADGLWANKLAASAQNKFTDWSCDIGLSSLFVQFEGSIRRGNCPEGDYFARIQDQTYPFPTEPVTCRQSECQCTTDILIEKRRPLPVQPAAKPRSGSVTQNF